MLATLSHGTVKDGDFRIDLIWFKPSYLSKLGMVYFLLIVLINSITNAINATTKVPNANISCNVSETDT